MCEKIKLNSLSKVYNNNGRKNPIRKNRDSETRNPPQTRSQEICQLMFNIPIHFIKLIKIVGCTFHII